jgi:hypothetical protein
MNSLNRLESHGWAHALFDRHVGATAGRDVHHGIGRCFDLFNKGVKQPNFCQRYMHRAEVIA